MNDILTCPSGSIDTTSQPYPICLDDLGNPAQFVLNGQSSFWNVTLTTAEVAEILGAVCFTFALVWCIKLIKRVMFNSR